MAGTREPLTARMEAYAMRALAEGASDQEVLRYMLSWGMDPSTAEGVLARALASVNRRERRERVLRTFAIGLAILVLALTITVYGYLVANPGWTFLAATALFVTGAFIIMNALSQIFSDG